MAASGAAAAAAAAAAARTKGRRIAVAVDEGEESLYALSWCLANIVHDGSSDDTLVLIYARPARVLYTTMDGAGYLFSTHTMACMERYYEGLADSVVANAKMACTNYPNMKVETRVETGDARDVICEAVEKYGVDMLVMGSHGYGLVKRAFLGSVSSHCAQNVKCPVLIVKKPKN